MCRAWPRSESAKPGNSHWRPVPVLRDRLLGSHSNGEDNAVRDDLRRRSSDRASARTLANDGGSAAPVVNLGSSSSRRDEVRCGCPASPLPPAPGRQLQRHEECPYEHLVMAHAVDTKEYTAFVIHDTLGRRVSPSLLRARQRLLRCRQMTNSPPRVQVSGGLLVFGGLPLAIAVCCRTTARGSHRRRSAVRRVEPAASSMLYAAARAG